MRPVGLLLLCAVGWAAEGPDMQASTHGQCVLPARSLPGLPTPARCGLPPLTPDLAVATRAGRCPALRLS